MDRSNVHFENKDLFEELPNLPSDFFDLCIVDPPYGASTKHKWSYGDKERKAGFGGEWRLTSEVWDLLSQNDSFTGTYMWLKELDIYITIQALLMFVASFLDLRS